MGKRSTSAGINLMYEVFNFCEERKTGKKIQDAFVAYCKSSVSESYQLKSNETVTGLLMKFTREEVENLWNKFVLDLRDVLSK